MTSAYGSLSSLGARSVLGLLGSFLLAAACGTSPVSTDPANPEDAYWVGVFTTSTLSYEDAARSESAVRFDDDGTFEDGQWDVDARHFEPAAGRDAARHFVKRWQIDHAAHDIRFMLDGAEESATFTVDGPGRWQTLAENGAEMVVVHYVRRH